jgi:hypothetical protein
MSDDFITGDEFDPEVAAQADTAAYENKLTQDSAVEAHVRRCKQAYAAVFVGGNATPDDVDFVMRDLGWFCNANDAQWNSDPREQDRAVARREVYQRIVEYARLDYDTLAKRYLQTQN